MTFGDQGNFIAGYYTSNTNLQVGAINDLKNNAASIGGNVIFVVANTAGLDKVIQTSITSTANVFA